jgi:hypothetical protein
MSGLVQLMLWNRMLSLFNPFAALFGSSAPNKQDQEQADESRQTYG